MVEPIGNPNDGKRKPECPFMATGAHVVMLRTKLEKIGNIFTPDGPDGKSSLDQRFEVIAVGPDVQHIGIGDLVIPHPGVGVPFSVVGMNYVICEEDGLIAILAESRGETVTKKPDIAVVEAM